MTAKVKPEVSQSSPVLPSSSRKAPLFQPIPPQNNIKEEEEEEEEEEEGEVGNEQFQDASDDLPDIQPPLDLLSNEPTSSSDIIPRPTSSASSHSSLNNKSVSGKPFGRRSIIVRV